MQNDKDTEIKTKYDNYSVDELKAALKNYFFFSGEFSDADMEEMNQIMAVLDRKEPISSLYTAEESLMRFQETYGEELSSLGVRNTEEVIDERSEAAETIQMEAGPAEGRQKRDRGLLRVGLIAAAVVVLMTALTVAASALGFNLWGWVPKWGDEVMSFESEETEKKPTVEAIPDMLLRLGITDKLYPTWIPEDFTRTEARIGEDPFFLHETFQGNDRQLVISISPTSGSETAVYQKEGTPQTEYLVGDMVHYIFDNTNEVSAVWYTENYTTLIVGNISFEEMQNIIDSIYGVIK